MLSERAGLIALSLEGYMLGGAFCAVAATYATHSPWIGVIAAVVGGGALALLYAGLAHSKRRSGLAWFLASLLLGPIAPFLLVAFCDPLPPS